MSLNWNLVNENMDITETETASESKVKTNNCTKELTYIMYLITPCILDIVSVNTCTVTQLSLVFTNDTSVSRSTRTGTRTRTNTNASNRDDLGENKIPRKQLNPSKIIRAFASVFIGLLSW